MRTFKPLGDRLLVRPDALPEKQTTGLAAPPSQKEAPTEGIVVAVGPDAVRIIGDPNGRHDVHNPAGVVIGERVQYTKYAGRDVKHNGTIHKLLRLEEVEGLIEDDGQ